jgi:hypothetical protein
MDSGNYNGEGYSPAGYSAHERWLMGWLTPTELTTATTVTNMPALSDEPKAYLIRNDGWKNEYYFIENRQKTGWDAEIPGHGVVVFHIDFDPSVWTSTKIMPNSSSNKRYTIFPANNNTSTSSSNVSKWGYPYQGNDSLTNFSTPKAMLNHENVDGDSLMSKPITNMIVYDGMASFKFMPSSATGIREQKNAYSKATVLYRFGNFCIIRSEKGEIRKVLERSK